MTSSKLFHWQKELSERIISISELSKVVTLTSHEKDANSQLKTAITPHLLSLIDKNNPECPIRKQFIPTNLESNTLPIEKDDPIGDKKYSPVPHIIHRYQDRCLLLPTYQCAAYCRFCFRRRVVSHKGSIDPQKSLKKAFNYIKSHPEIKEVILSGGDPLTLSDPHLEYILDELKKIEHLRFLRIHTRILTTLPSRITTDLLKILKKYKSLWLVLHTNHPLEITSKFDQALHKLQKNGIPIVNQSVLLKGINDDEQTMKELLYKLVERGVKPYYLHQCDLAEGTSHFRTTLAEGKRLLQKLQESISGLCIPHYMLDNPGGCGKMPVDYCD